MEAPSSSPSLGIRPQVPPKKHPGGCRWQTPRERQIRAARVGGEARKSSEAVGLLGARGGGTVDGDVSQTART